MPEVRIQRSEVRSQRSEVRGQNSELFPLLHHSNTPSIRHSSVRSPSDTPLRGVYPERSRRVQNDMALQICRTPLLHHSTAPSIHRSVTPPLLLLNSTHATYVIHFATSVIVLQALSENPQIQFTFQSFSLSQKFAMPICSLLFR